MPQITSIIPQKNKKRVNIYLDGKFAFGLDLQTFLKNNLKVEQELSDEQIKEIVKKGEFQNTYDKILRFATLRPRSEKEYEIWLIKHKVHESLKKELFKRLKHLELLDDEKFAKWWVEQRGNFKPKPKKILIQELRIKGIGKDIIDKVLVEEKIDEKKIAEKLLLKKDRLWKNLPKFEKRKKMFAYLMQKGFQSETISSILGEISDDLT